ncbi:MAG: plasmid stabilization protein [Sulfurimonas sp.]|nr:MAG: plasmid stabilization protein [Sulfurimonas sp.]
MKLIKKRSYQNALKTILLYIAKDSKNNAINFKNKLNKVTSNLNYMPYKYPHSDLSKNENVRSLAFKGYTILYYIDENKNQTVVFDIFKWINKEKD